LARLEHATRLLDVGGGTGRVTQALRQAAPEAWVLDLSWGMLRQVAGKPFLIPCQGQAEALPFGDGCFSTIIAVDSFHHFHHYTLAAQELVRVLAPGGVLVIEEPDIRRFPVKLIALGERLALMRSHFYRPDALMDFFDGPGVSLTLHEQDWNFWVVVEKEL
jgi:demethylmenaquinone methyltransferase/2-methoxy-6-polyprenyl-1,4-benzoquinol methylase